MDHGAIKEKASPISLSRSIVISSFEAGYRASQVTQAECAYRQIMGIPLARYASRPVTGRADTLFSYSIAVLHPRNGNAVVFRADVGKAKSNLPVSKHSVSMMALGSGRNSFRSPAASVDELFGWMALSRFGGSGRCMAPPRAHAHGTANCRRRSAALEIVPGRQSRADVRARDGSGIVTGTLRKSLRRGAEQQRNEDGRES